MTNKNIQIGDTVMERIQLDKGRSTVPYKGTVIYIHPERRFYRAEFELAGGKVRESFLINGGKEKNVKKGRPREEEIEATIFKSLLSD